MGIRKSEVRRIIGGDLPFNFLSRIVLNGEILYYFDVK
jgi:hypothetical protein